MHIEPKDLSTEINTGFKNNWREWKWISSSYECKLDGTQSSEPNETLPFPKIHLRYPQGRFLKLRRHKWMLHLS